ncbi:protein of unknown function [bacterium A37T11]|nr:protein of unknown function [bacterium A37T11]
MKTVSSYSPIFSTCLLFLAGQAFAQVQKFTLLGQMTIQKIPKWVYLCKDGKKQPSDSAAIIDGQFSFTGELIRPQRASLFTGRTFQEARAAYNLQFYLESDTIYISSPDTLVHASVSGGIENQRFLLLKEQLKPAYQVLKSLKLPFLQREYKLPLLSVDGSGTTEVLPGSFKNGFKKFESLHWHLTQKFIRKYPDSTVSLDALLDSLTGHPNAKELQDTYQSLSVNLRKQSHWKPN